ncbi:hypothetical protein P5G65_12045 [Paenibacillus chondroitinus]|uniref:Uncharacterized protein n=1 Tax=Paenibacillus chondroitinus TaxID=59842 RepID=A0ABU6DBI6_9BACL|nr:MULTISPECIES: hypothetical protein [Paenibacillus]MEB4794632.1 hypothetical protein [Paenibacillus chondroitinus]
MSSSSTVKSKQLADEHQLKTISDLTRISGEIRAGMTLELSDLED